MMEDFYYEPLQYPDPLSPRTSEAPAPAERTGGNGGRKRRYREEPAGTLYRDILEHLSFPVIAVDGEQRIILSNRKARELSETDPIHVGRMIFECLPDAVSGRVALVARTSARRTIPACEIHGAVYEIECIPLAGESGKGGAFLILKAEKESD